MTARLSHPELRPIVVNPKHLRIEFAFHLGLMIAATAVIAMSFLMRCVGENLVFLPWSSLPLPESCTAKQLLGISCPGCGLTRAFISISDGQWARAWHFNPASFAVYAFVIGQIPWRIFQMSRIATNRLPVFSVWLFAPLAVMTGCLLLQWVVGLIP